MPCITLHFITHVLILFNLIIYAIYMHFKHCVMSSFVLILHYEKQYCLQCVGNCNAIPDYKILYPSCDY